MQCSYCAPFALGAVAGTDAVVVVDLDDDDATFHDDAGNPQEAAKYRALVAEIKHRAERVLSVTGFGTAGAIANSVVPAPARSADRIPGRRVVMVGNFGYPPNVDGARRLIDEVLPHREDDIEFAVAGPGSEQFAPFGIGYAPDLDVRPGVDCDVADDPAAFAAAVLRLIDDRDRAHAGQGIRPRDRRDGGAVVTDPTALTTHRLTGWEAAIFDLAGGGIAMQVRATAAALARAGLIHTVRR